MQAAAGREAFFLSDMGMWGMLLWVIECAECHGHSPVDLRGRWRPLQAARPRPRFFWSDMGIWGMLLWVIECAECHGHIPVDLRGRWRPLQATAGREAEAEIFFVRYGHVGYVTMGY